MSTNTEVAELFRAIADLLDLKGERFKPEAYRRAARSIESLGEDLRNVANRQELDRIPGVGEALRDKILEYLAGGQIPYYERLKTEVPPGVVELMRVPGLGPKTTGRLLLELRIDSPAALRAAIDGGRLAGLAGFGERRIEKLRQALAGTKEGIPARMPLRAAWELARSIVRELTDRTCVQSVEIAGSLRRRRESVGDLDILATSAEARSTIDAFARLDGVLEVVLKGDTKVTVRHAPGVQVDLRVVEPDSFGAALQYFTGSKDHNVRLRTIARDRGLKINEYGVFRGEERVAGRTEEEVYRSLDMPWIPPEIRENQGEIEAAIAGSVPRLVDGPDLVGELHRHVDESATGTELGALAREARKRRLSYLGLVLRPRDPGALGPGVLSALREKWRSVAVEGPRLLLGVEAPLRTLVGLRAPKELDYTVGALESTVEPPPFGDFVHPPLFVSHPPAGPGGSTSAGSRLSRWTDWGRGSGIAFEVTPDAAVDGIEPGEVRRWVAGGGTVAISAGMPDSPRLDGLELAVGVARRGWASPTSVVNARADLLLTEGPTAPRGRIRRGRTRPS